MTVQEFIEKLKELDQNKKIFIWNKDDLWSDDIHIIDKKIFYIVDAD